MNSGGVMLWSMLSVVGAMTFNETKSNIKWLILYTVMLSISFAIDEKLTEYFEDIPKEVGIGLGAMNLVVISNIVFGLSIFLLYNKENANKKLKETIKNIQNKTNELHEKNLQLESVSNKLSKYLAPQVYNSIFTGTQNVNTESKRKMLTIFFSDIVGFTSITDKIEPENLSILLNEYLNKM
ncbi:MAG: hypothetical protein KDK36_02180 [Leptospiraceae bacterium]|nr:hypothetical protein [Leptospiraceae bacterium]